MPQKNYLNLDINKLFEDHTIKEIEQIAKKIQAESDHKKIELRTLVGERYRDLIQAADTIAEMRTTTECVIKRIADIEDTFKDLQQKYLIGFKIDPCEKVVEKHDPDTWDSVIVQIKILMDIPEYIWSAIDDNDLLKASQLFILAQHINFSLNLQVGHETLTLKYPVVIKQWTSISNFRRIISEECSHILKSIDLSPKLAANCLAALVLLEKTQSKDLLKKLIDLRCRAVESIIKSDDTLSVKYKIKLAVKLLMDTVALIHICFINSNNHETGLITQYIAEIKDLEAVNMLVHCDCDTQLINDYLPELTKEHKLFTLDSFVPLTIEELHEHFSSWLSWIREFTSQHVARLLTIVTSVRGIYNVREEAVGIQLPENWTNIWKDLSLTIINFWSDYFHPLLTHRVKEIIATRWEESLADLKNNLTSYLIKLNNDKFDYPENDLRWYLWKDSPTDIPQKLTKLNNTADFINKRSLLMKARGYSPNLVLLCQQFDEDLKKLLIDLELYLYESEKMTSVINSDDLLTINLSSLFDKFNDRSCVHDDLQRTSALMIDNLIGFIKNKCINPDTFYGKSDINIIVMARFLQALTSLCTNLNKCFTLSKISGLTISNVKWQTICDKIRDESYGIWGLWASKYREVIKDYVNKIFKNDFVDGSSVKSIVSEWERVTIEEEAEDGERIKSEILVPYQPSAALQKFFAVIVKDLNKLITHTIPKKIVADVVEGIVEELEVFYGAVAKRSLRQKQAFQLLLDVKYVGLLMVPRENKVLNDKLDSVCGCILEKIDPFDSDVFSPFIHANVKKSVQRSLLIYGNLIPHLEQLHSVLGGRSELGDSGKSITNPPGVLAVCTGAPWFPPLAVTVPSRNLPLIPVAMPDKLQRKKVAKEHTRSDSTGATIKSGAAAFFGAMGSDWFSNS
ncbi:conserved oligomeric Golgi complex subunit 1 isoform X1 [Microplitis mediator]|uniref:conserved oligomeric Golgi complex subunit 1 isoform X1 n=1 Tax=Microplitis mediator TaxID=375433 RepID=UPI0025564AC8|nr:conserved oligomeric Golgi complex subunit 1 isoform X1 [Microplitis mediator]